MSTEIDGYGQRPNQSDIDRLLEDCRTLSASGIERIAQSWMENEAAGSAEHTDNIHELPSSEHAQWVAAEREALHVLEQTNRAAEWDALRNRILDLTERHDAMVSWREEHGAVGHRAEDALLGAALALCVGNELDSNYLQALVTPMSAALPWLSGSLSATR
jgi:hypothetical protein